MTPIDAARWAKVRDLLEGALDRPRADRAAWLETNSGGDPELRAEVERLLAADERSGARLDTPLDLATFMNDESETSDSLAAGARIDKYAVEDVLGRGGMGVVYRAWDTRLERRVALKALSPHLPSVMEGRDRLHREAVAMARISHESVATVYELLEFNGQLFLVSELIDGETLRARLERGRLSPREGTDIVLQIARGVAAAHNQGVVHRDLKPENVLLTAAGRAKVVDFGIASFEGTAGITQTGVVIGTPGYMAPEQLESRPADARSDVFAIGVILYEVLGGKAPFGNTRSHRVVSAVLERDPDPLSDLVPELSPALEHVVMTCLAKPPAARYSNAGALVAALEPVAVEMARGVKPTPSRITAARPQASSGRWWLQVHQLAASAALALMMVPAWKLMSRLPRLSGRLLVMTLLMLAAAVGTARLHLWFTARDPESDLHREISRMWPVVRWGNRIFAALLFVGGAAVIDSSPELAAVCLACAAGTLAVGEIVEPTTIERALGPRGGDTPRP